ncbi:hypothetical protein SAMN05421858_3316 [Haladaptatus litoreus]|uniref:Uncharacterized protein n=1 Tax=Haladaptatus litoreus TaxID=553468 RepID=A0A1N7CXB4_9EURY|nr:hypothetical protein SAMN05421858_3316 [Haladaptatus litoreus]
MAVLFTLTAPSIGTGSRIRPESAPVRQCASVIVNLFELYSWRVSSGSLREPDDRYASETMVM